MFAVSADKTRQDGSAEIQPDSPNAFRTGARCLDKTFWRKKVKEKKSLADMTREELEQEIYRTEYQSAIQAIHWAMVSGFEQAQKTDQGKFIKTLKGMIADLEDEMTGYA